MLPQAVHDWHKDIPSTRLSRLGKWVVEGLKKGRKDGAKLVKSGSEDLDRGDPQNWVPVCLISTPPMAKEGKGLTGSTHSI